MAGQINNYLRSAEIADNILRTWALEHPDRMELIVKSTNPDAAERIFARPKGGK